MKHLITELSHIYLFVGHGQSIWKLNIKLKWQERRFRFNAVEWLSNDRCIGYLVEVVIHISPFEYATVASLKESVVVSWPSRF